VARDKQWDVRRELASRISWLVRFGARKEKRLAVGSLLLFVVLSGNRAFLPGFPYFIPCHPLSSSRHHRGLPLESPRGQRKERPRLIPDAESHHVYDGSPPGTNLILGRWVCCQSSRHNTVHSDGADSTSTPGEFETPISVSTRCDKPLEFGGAAF
jgi:hypothetical protein